MLVGANANYQGRRERTIVGERGERETVVAWLLLATSEEVLLLLELRKRSWAYLLCFHAIVYKFDLLSSRLCISVLCKFPLFLCFFLQSFPFVNYGLLVFYYPPPV